MQTERRIISAKAIRRHTRNYLKYEYRMTKNQTRRHMRIYRTNKRFEDIKYIQGIKYSKYEKKRRW